MNADEQAVAAAMARYQDALNGSDTNAVMNLYAADGVFMPQNSPPSNSPPRIGAEAVRQASDAVFSAITLTVEFKVAEIRQLEHGHAARNVRRPKDALFARCT